MGVVLTFLGTGTSQGIPMIGCSCAVCTSQDPRDQRMRTSLLISTPEQKILIDTTPDLRFQCLREKINHIDAVLFTHAHTDHIMGFDDLRRFCELQEKPMPIYAAPVTMEKIHEAFRFVFEDTRPFKNYLAVEQHAVEGPFFLGELEIIPVPLEHGRMPVLGFVFKHKGKKLLAYYTDCQAISPEAAASAFGAEVLIIDALRDRPHPTHLNFEGAIEGAGRIQAKQTFFIHFCHDVAHAEKEKQLPPSYALAYDGLKLKI
ncbi:MAG: MBL fold metallo-hydrolase [Chthoniobacterales bacterium]